MRAVRNVGRTVAGEHNDTQIRESALGILRPRKLYAGHLSTKFYIGHESTEFRAG